MFSEQITVFDDFYANPDEVRIGALARQDWNSFGNYPGIRTGTSDYQSALSLRDFFEKNIVRERIDGWMTGANTCFQLTYSWDDTWVHMDGNDYAAIVYLTPDADPESGTGFFRHKESGIDRFNGDSSTNFNGDSCMHDISKWEKLVEVGNVYNRCVVYNARLYHRSMVPGFGSSLESGRLTQVFFFNKAMSWY